MKRLATVAAVKLLVLSVATLAWGDIILTIKNSDIPIGGTGYVDLMISSNSPGGDLLSAFNLDLRLSSQGQTRLEFMPTQPDPQLTDANYVFYGNSLDHDDPLNAWPMSVGTVRSFSEPNDRFVGGDATADFLDLIVTSTPKLLVRLELNANTALMPNDGDAFALSVDASGSSFQYGDIVNPTLVSFTSGPGTITVSSVPEPSALTSLTAGLLTVFGIRFLRGRRQRERYCLP